MRLRMTILFWVPILFWYAFVLRIHVQISRMSNAGTSIGFSSLEKKVLTIDSTRGGLHNKQKGEELVPFSNLASIEKRHHSIPRSVTKPHGIFVLGMHRSGTSLLTGALNLYGYTVDGIGPLKGATEFNAKGYFELESLVLQNQDWLTGQKVHWAFGHGQFDPSKAQLNDAGQQTLIRIQNTTTTAMSPWILKDPRLCITLPAWDRYLAETSSNRHQAGVPLLFVYRNPLSVALSMCQRSQTELFFALKSWTFHNIHAIRNQRRGRHCFVPVNIQTWMDNPIQQTIHTSRQLYEKCGLPMPAIQNWNHQLSNFQQEMSEFVSKSLFHSDHHHQVPVSRFQKHRDQTNVVTNQDEDDKEMSIIRAMFRDCSFPRPHEVMDLNLEMLQIANNLYEDMETGVAFKESYQFPQKLPRMKGGIIERKMQVWITNNNHSSSSEKQ